MSTKPRGSKKSHGARNGGMLVDPLYPHSEPTIDNEPSPSLTEGIVEQAMAIAQRS